MALKDSHPPHPVIAMGRDGKRGGECELTKGITLIDGRNSDLNRCVSVDQDMIMIIKTKELYIAKEGDGIA